jgi:flagellar assembly factor FliW
MHIRTTRFGPLEIEADDVIHFPAGLLGLEDCRPWVLLADAQNDALGWLQSTTRPEMALAVVSPRRFVPDYQFRVFRSELNSLELGDVKSAQVLVIVGKNEHTITLNLKAPVVINLERRLGRQVVANGDHSVQFELTTTPAPLKKSA